MNVFPVLFVIQRVFSVSSVRLDVRVLPICWFWAEVGDADVGY